MNKTITFMGMLSLAGLGFLGACDVDDASEIPNLQDLHENLDAQTPQDNEVYVIPLDAPEELEIEEDNWSDFDLANASQPVAHPPGTTCCVNCADGWSGWWNRGTGDECNKRGAKWCHDHNWNFLNAEWFNKCPAG